MKHVRQAKEKVIQKFATAPKTKKGRASSLKSWNEFCGKVEVSNIPTVVSLGDYITHEVLRKRKASGILTSISSIGNYLVDEGLMPFPQWTEIIKSREIIRLKKSIKVRDQAIGVHIKKAAAITETQLRSLCEMTEDPDEIVLSAVAITGFYNLHRGGELVASVPGEERLKLPYASSVKVSADCIEYLTRSEKMGQYEKTTSFLRSTVLPKWAMQKWHRFWSQRQNGPFKNHPDLFILSSGVVASGRNLSAFLARIGKFSTHSLRAGGATNMMSKGATLLQVQVKGRWKCNTSLMGYLRASPAVGRALKQYVSVDGICQDPALEEF